MCLHLDFLIVLVAMGEVSNFGAYAFAPTILVTPLGAISVVVSAILSIVFLKEKLNFSGTAGICLCVIGATIIVLHGPSSTATETIPAFIYFVMAPGFLTYSCVSLVFVLYMIFHIGPRYGHVHPIVYISITSIVGSFLVNAAQGFGSSFVYSLRHWEADNQFVQWPIYPLFVFIVITVIIQVNYLNKSLSYFSTSIVTPVYFVFFSSATLTTSAVLYQGFNVATVIDGISIILGFVVIVIGVSLLFQYNLKLNKMQVRFVEDINDAEVDDEEQQGDQNPLKLMAESFPLNPKPKGSTLPRTSASGNSRNANGHTDGNELWHDEAGGSGAARTYVRHESMPRMNMVHAPIGGNVGLVQQAVTNAESMGVHSIPPLTDFALVKNDGEIPVFYKQQVQLQQPPPAHPAINSGLVGQQLQQQHLEQYHIQQRDQEQQVIRGQFQGAAMTGDEIWPLPSSSQPSHGNIYFPTPPTGPLEQINPRSNSARGQSSPPGSATLSGVNSAGMSPTRKHMVHPSIDSTAQSLQQQSSNLAPVVPGMIKSTQPLTSSDQAALVMQHFEPPIPSSILQPYSTGDSASSSFVFEEDDGESQLAGSGRELIHHSHPGVSPLSGEHMGFHNSIEDRNEDLEQYTSKELHQNMGGSELNRTGNGDRLNPNWHPPTHATTTDGGVAAVSNKLYNGY
ncbi:hypothetical protein QVD99_002318 [Batrachochytrium dendrobatidis]|nr:hypothetical protein QVD99_002318 [Batrachochytrium dendrobatidis]